VILVVAGLLLGGAESLSGVVRVARHDVRITATGDLVGSSGFVFAILAFAVVVLSLAAWLGWLAVQVPTYRRADGERRQQLKWLYSGAAVTLIAFIFGAFVIPLVLGDSFGSPANPVINALFILSFGALPVFMGVAVLRYRLYELDRIISRVMSYALVTALLVGVYTGLVLAATHLLPHKSAVAVAISTLITAALFSPVRRRVQRVVDRRFNRSRYDAEALVAAFTGRLRHTVDLDAVRDDFVSAVDQAFQPTQVSMWLAPPGREAVSGTIVS
jgi:MFS family permease